MDDQESSDASQDFGKIQISRGHKDRKEDDGSNYEATGNDSAQRPQPLRRRSSPARPVLSSVDIFDSVLIPTPSTSSISGAFTATTNLNTALQSDSFARGRDSGSRLSSSRAQSSRGRDSAVGSPPRWDDFSTENSFETSGAPGLSLSETNLTAAVEDRLLEDDLLRSGTNTLLPHVHLRSHTSFPLSEASTPPRGLVDSEFMARNVDSRNFSRVNGSRGLSRHSHHDAGMAVRRVKANVDNDNSKELSDVLKRHGARTAILYRTAKPDPESNDIWPNFRNAAKLPVHYSILDLNPDAPTVNNTFYRHSAARDMYRSRRQRVIPAGQTFDAPSAQITPAKGKGRPFWQLPVELVEQIIEHLNRDDIKSLRLVSRELNDFTSQAAFKTVVVPFNTEIYGMLGQGPKADRKGKKRAKINRPEYWWKNANGDEIYNGHGLDVFRGFGRHILRYGMSFEVSEESLSAPPLKSVTEQKTSFWGNYEWPFEEYRRFDAVAGLEFAADETPRMKTAFSELTKVKELALSVDSGLGWLTGPDRSIRDRILQTPPSIFGSHPCVPDRRTQAQREFWDHIEGMHADVGEDIRLALLFRLEGMRLTTEAEEAGLIATDQPSQPFLDAQIPQNAIPLDISDHAPSQPLEDADMLEHHASTSRSAHVGLMFTSTKSQHCDAAQVVSPIVPASLSKAQREWLLETEWAQRAFMSSYMLAIIDNASTFATIHTLNISSLSDRYLPLLNRTDFWDALPCLKEVCLMVIPGWRTVEKDEAGFVEAPKVDPTGHVDTFCGLLEAQVASRNKIAKLKIGYTASGEHAEGSHARNKLLMPAPLLPLRARIPADPNLPLLETITVQDASILKQVILRFPHLEELTLCNCWIKPSVLLQFVKVHDAYALKRLALESVSLTAMLRPIGNAQAANVVQQPAPPNAAVAQQIAGAMWAQANNNPGGNHPPVAYLLPGNGQILNNFIQMLIAQLQQLQANAGGVQQHQHVHALQNQLQQQLQNVQAMTTQQPQANALHQALNAAQPNQQAQQQQQQHAGHITQLNHLVAQVTFLQQLVANQNAPPAGMTANSASNNGSILQARPREGSWMDIIDQISPGTNLSNFGSTHSQADPDRTTSLESITFVSCGYAKLPHIGLAVDQATIETSNGMAAALRNPLFAKRHNALAPAMLSSRWQYLGEVVQEVNPNEMVALDVGWNLRLGWDDVEAARAAEFDGLLPGGTGRFSGTVQRSDRVDDGGPAA